MATAFPEAQCVRFDNDELHYFTYFVSETQDSLPSGVSNRPPKIGSEVRLGQIISVLAYSFHTAQKVQVGLEQAQSFSFVLLCFRLASRAERSGITASWMFSAQLKPMHKMQHQGTYSEAMLIGSAWNFKSCFLLRGSRRTQDREQSD